MKKYKYLLFDNDETLMDFEHAQELAFKETYDEFSFDLPYDSSMLLTYSDFNNKWWQNFEKGLCIKEDLVVNRFKDFLESMGLSADGKKMNERYEFNLSKHNHLIDGALTLLRDLKPFYKIYIITNGVSFTQNGRIKTSPIFDLIDGFFVSEDVGYNKPNPMYFDYVLDKISAKRSECLIIGDSLTSDIKGANNSFIDCVWFNKKHIKSPKEYYINHEITSLNEIYDILEFKK